MKTRTKFLLPLMLLCIAVFALALTASAETKTGKCGTNLTYTLDTDTGTLAISGTGEMEDFGWGRAPWSSNSSSIRTVVIADGATSIGKNAFYCCSSLESITIPDSVTSIGDYAFYNCKSLESITIPNGVTSIGECAFTWCVSLTGIHVDVNNQNYTSVNGILFDKSMTTLIQAPSLLSDTAYTVPDGVTRIGKYAFNNCRRIKNITIPASVAEIGNSAFINTNIENVYISDLAAWCAIDFQGEHTSPVHFVGDSTVLYLNDTKLTQVEIPADITKISSMALPGFSSITQITVAQDNPNYMSVDGVLLSKDKTVLLTVPAGKTGSYTAPAGVTTVADTAFHHAKLTDVSLPSGVTSIGDHAFVRSEIVHVTLPDGLLSIGEDAFFHCDNLESITLPDSLTDVGQSAFCSCRSLESITIPAHVKGLYNQAFDFCDKLTSITILNPDCEIEYDATIPAAATIYGYAGSTAEAYAKKYDRTFVALDKPAKEYKQGDIITYGSYPQTRVTDSALIAKLDAQSGSWVSYRYYISKKQSDFMRYKDVTLDGAKYRAVKFSSYRPYYTGNSSSASNSNQDENGYSPNTVYWFKYEPVRWRVLDATDQENLLVLSESILDSQAFRNTYYDDGDYYTDSTETYYANNYAQSDIRAWLNGDFYNTTFSADEKSHIHTTAITNEAGFGYTQYDAASTQDKVFLLSYKEVLNADYGFSTSTSSSSTRYAQGSDYAKAQGLWASSSGDYAGNSLWRLRSAGFNSYRACYVDHDGGVIGNYYVYSVGYGVRAAFKFNPISSNPVEECDHTWTVTATQAANCTTPGSKTFECTKCGETKTEVIPVNDDHDYSTTWTTDTAATCGAPGSKSHHCTRCGAKTDITAIPATGAHTYVNGTCKDCGAADPTIKTGSCGDDLRYVLDLNTGVLTITGTGAMTNFSWNGAPWYADRAAVRTVTVEAGATTIGFAAFRDCANLETVTLPDSVTSIGYQAFYGCTSLADIVLPDSVTGIGSGAFTGCTSLTEVTLSDSVTGIGKGAFSGCSSLARITVQNRQCSIGDDATTIPAAATIYGYTGSTAEAYAKKYNRTFVALDKPAQKEYKQGDIITYGSYPQTKVTDSALIAKLDAQSGSWVSYGYYISSSKSDFMQYKDVTLDGTKYRAVKFSSYRPWYTTSSLSSANYSYQDDNGYYTNTVYWFKYEPVKWRVLDASDQKNLLILSESILDSQAFHHTTSSTNGYYANNYPQSDIRAWLNGDFYNTTFSADEKSHIHTTTITNEAFPGYSKYDAASTQDKVFLLSYAEATNSNYFSNNAARVARGSDYAKAQGLYVSSSGDYAGNSGWRLRSARSDSFSAGHVDNVGGVDYYSNVYAVSSGVRAAFRFNPISSNPIEACEHNWTVTATQAANCTTPGSKTLECTKCGETKTEIIPKNNDHDYSTTWTTDTAATCGAPGSKSHHCTRCGAKTDITVLPATGAHDYNTAYTTDTPAGCETAGTKSRHCKHCDARTDVTVVYPTGHDYRESARQAATCTADGYVEYTCSHSGCGAKKRLTLYATGHSYGADDKCIRCGAASPYAHEHNYTVTASVAASCTAPGYTVYTCSVCGDFYRTYTEALGHKWDDGRVTRAATCTLDGSVTYTCTRTGCGATRTAVVPAAHSYAETARTPATCTLDGSVTYTCTVCGAVRTEVLPAGHTWDSGSVTVPATCKTPGKLTHTCTVCHLTETVDIPAKGHRFYDGVCQNCHVKFIDTVVYDGESDLYGMYFKVDNVVSSYGDAVVNEYGVYLDVAPDAAVDKVGIFMEQIGTEWRRCIAFKGAGTDYASYVPYLAKDGEVLYSGLNNGGINTFPLTKEKDAIWRYSNYATIGANLADKDGKLLLDTYDIAKAGKRTRIFDDLDAMIAWLGAEAFCEHDYADTTVTVAPDCTKQGSGTRTCKICGETETVTIPALGHAYTVTSRTAPTCTASGSVTYRCTRCGATLTETLPPRGHSYGADGKCADCGKDKPAHTHSYTVTETVAPTCTKSGYTVSTCACGETKHEYIEPLGHSWNSGKVTAVKTCTTDGSVLYTCTVCGATRTETISAGHVWNYETVKPASCTENGTEKRTCVDCGKVEHLVLPAGHDWLDKETVRVPSCTTDGEKKCICRVCDEERSFPIPATGHNFVDGVCRGCGKHFYETVTPYRDALLYGMYFRIGETVSNYGDIPVDEYGLMLDVNPEAKIEKVGVYITQVGTTWVRTLACVGENITYAAFVPYLANEDGIVYSGLNTDVIRTFPLTCGADGIWRFGDYTRVRANLADKDGNLLLTTYDIGQAGKRTRVFGDLDEMIAWLGSDVFCEHDFGAGKVTRAATCAVEGEMLYTCRICGETKTAPIAKSAHSYGEWQVRTAAKCEETGVDYRVCTACSHEDTRTTAKLGHNLPSMPTEAEIPATCKAPGKTAVYRCLRDDCAYYEGGEVIPQKLYGDVNSDGEVSKADLLRLQKYLAGWDVEYDFEPSDLNLDGVITKADLLRLQKYLAGWDVAPWYAGN